MSRSVDKIERVVFSVKKIVHLYGVALDSDATLTLEIHVVEHLCLKVFFGYGMGIFQQAVGQVLLPWSIWAIMQKFLIRFIVCKVSEIFEIFRMMCRWIVNGICYICSLLIKKKHWIR